MPLMQAQPTHDPSQPSVHVKSAIPLDLSLTVMGPDSRLMGAEALKLRIQHAARMFMMHICPHDPRLQGLYSDRTCGSRGCMHIELSHICTSVEEKNLSSS